MSHAVTRTGMNCTKEIRDVCVDSGRRNVGGTMMYLSEVDPARTDNCWERQKVYQCIDNDYVERVYTHTGSGSYSLEATGLGKCAQRTSNIGLSRVASNYVDNSFDSAYSGGDGEWTERRSAYFAEYGYKFNCPSGPSLQAGPAQNSTKSSFDSDAIALNCKKNAGWDNVNSSTSLTSAYHGIGGVTASFGRALVVDSEWRCTTSVSSSCSASDIINCPIVGYECVGGENSNNANVVPLGTCDYANEIRICDVNAAPVCDSPIDSCEFAHSSVNIFLDPFVAIGGGVVSGVDIGDTKKYTCYEGTSETCDRGAGYSSCQWSYYDSCVFDSAIVASENTHPDNNGVMRNYGQCKSYQDHYVCPSETIVVCDDVMNSCGSPTVVASTPNSAGYIEHWVDEFICYNGAIDENCNDPDGNSFIGCTKVGATCTEYDNANNTNSGAPYGTCTKWVDDYICANDATYICDGAYQDCRSPVIRPGTQDYTDPYSGGNEIGFESPIETDRIDDFYCWTGDVDEVCSISDSLDKTQCNWTGYQCHDYEPEKDTPNWFDGRDYETCVDWTDNWVCQNHVQSDCSNEYTDCGPVDFEEGVPGEVTDCLIESRDAEVAYSTCLYNGGTNDGVPATCRAAHPAVSCVDSEGNTVVTNPDDVWLDWTEKYVCYTGDFIESCEDVSPASDIKQCQKTGFTCLVDDPNNKAPHIIDGRNYGTCVDWIDRYVCGSETYIECDTDYELCTSIVVDEQIENLDGVETFRRETEYCYTEEVNKTQCVLDEDKCWLYDEGVTCDQKTWQRDYDYQVCIDLGGSVATCELANPPVSCRVEVQCPVGDRFGVDCQLDWDAHDAAMLVCLSDSTKTVGDCELTAPLPACELEEIPEIDCPHSGFTCHDSDFNMTTQEAMDNDFEGRNYGYCVEWTDRFTCPQFQTQDCTASIDKTDCGPLGYVEISNVQDGQATDYTTVLECVESNAPDCNVDPACELVSMECAETSTELCRMKEQVWSCTINRDDCVEWSSSCAAPPSYDYGENNESANNIAEFIAKASVAKMVSDNTTMDAGAIRIFAGKDRWCRTMDKAHVQAMIAAALIIIYWTGDYDLLSFVMTWSPLLMIDYDCCKVDRSAQISGQGMGASTTCDPNNEDCSGYSGGILEMLVCSEEETELSKSRGAKNVVGSIGKFCSVDIIGFCLEDTYSFCEFDNLFSRIVQEQGREQIANALTKGPVAAVEELMNFPYYTSTPGGGWNLTEVNGNKVAFWSWDQSCNNYNLNLNPPENVTDYLPPVCPYADEVHIVSCEGNQCFHLPDAPYTTESAGAPFSAPATTGYTDYDDVSIANPFMSESFALTKSMYVTGMCGSSVVDGYDQGLIYAKDSWLLTDWVLFEAPSKLMSGSDVIDTILGVQIQWGDGVTTNMSAYSNGSGWYANKYYYGASSAAGFVVKATLFGSSGNSYITEVNILVTDASTAPSNINDNTGAGRVYFTGQAGFSSINDCEYKISAYPHNSGATTQIGYDINWVTNSFTPKWSSFEYSVGNNVVIPYEMTGGTTGVSTVKIKINNVEYDLPKDTGGSEVSIGGLSFIGSCSDIFYSCNFRAYTNLMLELMPWGNGEEPNCRGFSVDEIEALDFGAMDLDEWIATMLPDPPSEADIEAQASGSATSKEAALKGGAQVSNGFVKAIYYDEITAHPRESFTFQAIESFKINEDVEEVFNRVVVNWGDEGNTFYDMNYNTSTGFTATKIYNNTSGTAGFNVQFALYANSGRIYNTSVKILIGYGSNTKDVLKHLGGGEIEIKDFSITTTSESSLADSQGVP